MIYHFNTVNIGIVWIIEVKTEAKVLEMGERY